MNTTPSPTGERPHVWSSARDFGQGDVEFCVTCGVRKGDPREQHPCAGAPTPESRPVKHDYDPLG